MSAHSISHALRDSKKSKGIAVNDTDLISFPEKRHSLDLYYDGEAFVYTDYKTKYIVKPNYKIKLSSGKEKVVAMITAGKTNGIEFQLKKYIKI